MSHEAMTDAELWASLTPSVGPSPVSKAQDTLRVAFYGRCSTEDLQDPVTSMEWQMRAARTLLGTLAQETEIVATYFDIDQSRSLPWKRRPQAQRLLEDLTRRQRPWDAVVVGEGQRCWYGSQFADTAPLFDHAGVAIYVPDLGGAYDPKNPTHFTLMSVTGGMSRAERQRVQERVRLGMAVQVEMQGRFQGGRAPYGYKTVGEAPHPNPRKAAEGVQIKRLIPSEPEAAIVRRIFTEWLDGRSLREIADRLTRDRVVAPATASDSATQKAWRASTVRHIVTNGRYTGYEVWGKTTRHETLVDPTDPSWGYRTKFIAKDGGPTRSRERVHEPIVSLDDFTQAQQILHTKAATGQRGPRVAGADQVTYPLRSLLTCEICGRTMGAERYGKNEDPQRPTKVRYRCRTRDLLADDGRAASHPSNIRMSQNELLTLLADWFGEILSPANRPDLLAAIREANQTPQSGTRFSQVKMQLKDAETRYTRLIRAIEAGINPESLADLLNQTFKEIESLQAEMAASQPESHGPSDEEVESLLHDLTSTAQFVLGPHAAYVELNEFFRAVDLRLVYDARKALLTATCGALGRYEPGASISARWVREKDGWRRVDSPTGGSESGGV